MQHLLHPSLSTLHGQLALPLQLGTCGVQVAGVGLQVGDDTHLLETLTFAQGSIGGKVLQCLTHLGHLIQKGRFLSLGLSQEDGSLVH